MKIKDNLEINSYQDYERYKYEIFNILSDTIDMCIDDYFKRHKDNPSMFIPSYDELVAIEDLCNDKYFY